MNQAILADLTDGHFNFNLELSNFERSLIEKALFYCDGNVKQAARLMGIERTTLIYRISKLGLDHLKNKKESEK